MRSEDFVCKLCDSAGERLVLPARLLAVAFFFRSLILVEVFFSILAPFIYLSDVKKGVRGFVSRKRLFKAAAGSEQ